MTQKDCLINEVFLEQLSKGNFANRTKGWNKLLFPFCKFTTVFYKNEKRFILCYDHL